MRSALSAVVSTPLPSGLDIFEDAFGVDKARDTQPVLRLAVLYGVAAGDDAACLDSLGMSALQNGADILLGQAVRHAEKIHCDPRLAAHGVHVAQRVRRGDLAEEIGIVHDGGEEVDRFDDGDIIGDAVDGGIVAAVVSDEKIAVPDIRQIFQNFRKGTRPQFCRSPGGGGHLRETKLFLHAAHPLESLLQRAARAARGQKAKYTYCRELQGICQIGKEDGM